MVLLTSVTWLLTAQAPHARAPDRARHLAFPFSFRAGFDVLARRRCTRRGRPVACTAGPRGPVPVQPLRPTGQ